MREVQRSPDHLVVAHAGFMNLGPLELLPLGNFRKT